MIFEEINLFSEGLFDYLPQLKAQLYIVSEMYEIKQNVCLRSMAIN